MLIIVLCLLERSYSIITYDFGNVLSFDYSIDSSIVCQNSNSYTRTIAFSNSFAKVPQVVILPYLWDMTKAESDYTITSITASTSSKSISQIKDFVMTIKCTKQRMYSMRFRYAAFDDSRIEVINSFQNNMVNQGSQTFSFSHSNPNALQGFVNIVSFGYQGSMGLTLDIQSVTKETVTLTFTSSDTHLTLLGFQIVLGPPEAFTKSALITRTALSASISHNSGSITLSTGLKLLIPQISLVFLSSNNQNLRFNQSYTESGSIVTYTKQCWDSSRMDSVSWYEILLNSLNTKVLQPMLYKKMKISEVYSQNINATPLKLAFSELTNTYSGSVSDQITIDKAIQTITIILSINCSVNRKISLSILRCLSCNPQNLNWQQNCYGSINQITQSITFYQTDQVNQKISISLTTSSLSIIQTVYNQVKTDYTLLQATIVNI